MATIIQTLEQGAFRAYATAQRPGRSGPYAGTVNVWTSGPEHNTLVSSDGIDAYRHTDGEHAGQTSISVNGGYVTYHRTLTAALRAVAIAALNRAEEG